jgi:predicted  nucleic acid-binding Zn-ribbon protein
LEATRARLGTVEARLSEAQGEIQGARTETTAQTARADAAEQRVQAIGADLDQARRDLAEAFAALRSEAIQAREAQAAAEGELARVAARCEELEGARLTESSATIAAAAQETALQAEIEQQKAQIAILEGMLQATREQAAAPPDSGPGREVADSVGTFRAVVLANLDRAREDADAWKQSEVAIGRSIKDLLALAHRLPQHLDEVYRVLASIQDVLDSGKKLVRRNQQRSEEEVQALGELEDALGVTAEG